MNWTYVGVMLHRAYGAAFLVNLPGGFTRVLFSYKRTRPIRIIYIEGET